MPDQRGESARGYRVVGRVQGVGFRWWTRRTAARLGLDGIVRNLPDGSVEVHAVGSEAELERLREALTRGPAASRVEGVEVIPIDPAAWRSGFVIDG
ncbi:MAG TPA: acylphosphatase [Longimicrobiales bacterium]|nr:acylphosphatase [Longimicrobiales bacterium]